jgi:photosystem II stability/assembly factor-like uncharacterized protein
MTATDSSRPARLADKQVTPKTGTVAGFAGFAGDTAVAAIEIPSPTPAVRWRIASAGIERTTDGGMTWRDDGAPLSSQHVRYGVAVSADVCWFATREGNVLRRGADGTWSTRAVPGHPTVRALSASSPLDAAITTTEGQVFRTIDGGLTWTAMPPPR